MGTRLHVLAGYSTSVKFALRHTYIILPQGQDKGVCHFKIRGKKGMKYPFPVPSPNPNCNTIFIYEICTEICTGHVK